MYMKEQTRVSMVPEKNTFRHGDRIASTGRPPKIVLVTQSSRGIDLALLRLDLLEVKYSSLVKKYQGPRT